MDNVLLDGEAKIKVDVPFSERKNLGRWPSMDFSDLPPSSENPTAKNLQESILEREGVKPRVYEQYQFDGHLPSPEEMEQYEDPGSFNMEEEHVSVSPNMVAIHMRHLYRVMRCFRFFICRVVTPDGHIRSFNLRECMSERKLKGKPDPHDRYKIILMGHQHKKNFNFRIDTNTHVRVLSQFNLAHDVDSVRMGEHVWYRNFLRTYRGLWVGEVYRYDPHYRKGTKREPIQIILYWRPGQKVVVEDDPAYFEAFQNKLRIERIKYFKNRVPNPVYDGDNQDFYFQLYDF